jgi:hypothetical protein
MPDTTVVSDAATVDAVTLPEMAMWLLLWSIAVFQTSRWARPSNVGDCVLRRVRSLPIAYLGNVDAQLVDAPVDVADNLTQRFTGKFPLLLRCAS